MATEKKPKAFFTQILPRKPREGDSISIKAKLRKDPNEFRLLLGVRTAEDRNSSLEPSMIAFELKTVFNSDGIKVSTNWKTDAGWQNEQVVDSDWIDSKGRVNLKLSFENSSVLVTDSGNSSIAKYALQFELERINRLQLWGNIKEMHEVSLKYNSKLRLLAKKKSLTS